MKQHDVRAIKAIALDIDGTLTTQNSWTALTNDFGGSVSEHLNIYQDLTKGKIGLEESKLKLLELWQATGRANKKDIEMIFKTWSIRQDADKLINWLKDEGYLVCLITGSFDMYATYMADKLGISDYFSNAALYFDANGELINFQYDVNQAELKVNQFTEFCKRKNLKPTECAAVGDSDNDIGLFRLTNNGILIDHEKASIQLRQAAWISVRNLTEVQNILKSDAML